MRSAGQTTEERVKEDLRIEQARLLRIVHEGTVVLERPRYAVSLFDERMSVLPCDEASSTREVRELLEQVVVYGSRLTTPIIRQKCCGGGSSGLPPPPPPGPEKPRFFFPKSPQLCPSPFGGETPLPLPRAPA